MVLNVNTIIVSYDINVSKITLRVYGIESAVKYLYIRFILDFDFDFKCFYL